MITQEQWEDFAALAGIYLAHTEGMVEDPETTESPIMRRRALAATILEHAETLDRRLGLCGLIGELADALEES